MLPSPRISVFAVTVFIIVAFFTSNAPARKAAKVDRYAYANSDKSGKDCSSKHVIFVSFEMGGQHWGVGRKYMDLQIVGEDPSTERAFYAKTTSKGFVVCSVQRVIYDRWTDHYVNAVFKDYFPRRPGLSVNGTVPASSNRNVELIAFGRFKAKH
jgi:hypothetical protein